GRPKDTPSRRTVFVCQPRTAADERDCATKIISKMARLAYRRALNPTDVQTLMEFFTAGRREGGSFDSGIQFALERMLVDPDFLLRVYRDPVVGRPTRAPAERGTEPATYRLNDTDLATRLSFFLWGSVPDEALLDLAARGQLAKPSVLEQQVRRMLADPRAV